MISMTLDGSVVQFPPLTYGALKRSKAQVDALTADHADVNARTDAAIAFLLVSNAAVTAEAFDSASPGEIWYAAFGVYGATFSRPEDPAPAQTPSL